jgi:hypothetical protein
LAPVHERRSDLTRLKNARTFEGTLRVEMEVVRRVRVRNVRTECMIVVKVVFSGRAIQTMGRRSRGSVR